MLKFLFLFTVQYLLCCTVSRPCVVTVIFCTPLDTILLGVEPSGGTA